uniref:Craniofacial development protein 2-like n=1 Tax=Nicotiana tabacum TaxID=4097 RepID=A0A1S3ZLC8_TOBAC|nr:PREDICTED: uncharacterized protein LOC107788185 [Nicotiana tabacum]
MAERGMNLTYIAPIIQDGEKIVELNKEEIEKGSAKWSQALIIYVVKLPNLPMSYWEREILSRIGSGLGVPVYVVECTKKVEKISYARLLVEMDATRPLPKTIKVKDLTGDVYDQEIAGHSCNPIQNKKPLVGKQRGGATKPKQQWVRRTGNNQGNEGQNAPKIQGEKAKGKQIERKQNEIEGTSKESNAEGDQLQGVQWKIIRNKSATKGSYNIGQQNNFGKGKMTPTALVRRKKPVKVVNGFDPLIVYGLHIIEDRRGLWEALRSIQSSQQGPWLAMGDYNAVLQVEDRKYGNHVTEIKTKDFSDYLFDTGVTEMKSVGREYNWTNTHIYTKIDKALVNSE